MRSPVTDWISKKLLMLIACVSFSLDAQTPPVYVVLFTHIEDNTPLGALGSPESKQNYTLLRSRLITLANVAKYHGVKWTLQPDWKILLAALQYEDSAMIQSTNQKNVFRFLKENLNVVIDPHSHENGGYNYTDVAHLLDSIGVGASTVIGGHIWDPALPQFQNWDRFRVPVKGIRYPWAAWRGEILMGSGTPNHVNDPVVSGVWRPKDRDNYFIDDPAGNIVCVGHFKNDVAGVSELVNLYMSAVVSQQSMLTLSYHIMPAAITPPNGIAAIEDTIIKPLAALRSRGEVLLTDFTSLVGEWRSKFNSRAYIYDAKARKSTPVAWKQFFTLAPEEGVEFVVDSTAIVPGGGVPVVSITNAGKMVLTSAGGPQMRALEVSSDGRSYTPISFSQRGPDGGFVYLPDGRTRFLGEEPAPNNTPQRHRSRVVSWISNDGLQWVKENGIRYQPGIEDDSISSVVSTIQVADSVWRMYYVGDFYRTNGTRTAISRDWGFSWQQESKNNVLRAGDVDPHPVYLSNGKVRLYFRAGMGRPPEQAGIGYCDSDDGIGFDTASVKLLISDAVVPTMFKLDPAVVKLPNGQVVCYIGAAPSFGQTVSPKLIAAWGKKPAVNIERGHSKLDNSMLEQNFPNPFNPSTTIRYRIRDAFRVSLRIYNVLGECVEKLIDEHQEAGDHEVRWSAQVAAGIYFCHLRAGTYHETMKMLLMR